MTDDEIRERAKAKGCTCLWVAIQRHQIVPTLIHIPGCPMLEVGPGGEVLIPLFETVEESQ